MRALEPRNAALIGGDNGRGSATAGEDAVVAGIDCRTAGEQGVRLCRAAIIGERAQFQLGCGDAILIACRTQVDGNGRVWVDGAENVMAL